MHLGTVLPLLIEEIGGDIDFVILDTIHCLPGELLDFIAVLPYLKDGAVVVLHDIRFHQRFINYNIYNATCTLFSTVTANKFFNYQPGEVDLIYNYPDIGAFQINEQTRANIENVFLALTQSWVYFPTREYLRAYYKIYQKHYSADLCKIYEEALKMNFLKLREKNAIKDYKNGRLNEINILGDAFFE